MRRIGLSIFVFLALEAAWQPGAASSAMTLTSPAFSNGGSIPVRYTCDGADASPPLRWRGVPKATKELVLLVEDPDAPGGAFVHWVLYKINPRTTAIAENAIPKGAHEGRNDFNRSGWAGPCPPPFQKHRYVFTLYAVRRPTGLPHHGATAADTRKAMSGKVLGTGRLTGTYQCQLLACLLR